ncbi:MAG: hypothetical protein J6I84_04030 [Bacilli bacterium]|nr:hypothetical protein [Bacilli bacterium]
MIAKYREEITTRNGLWVVTFEIPESYKEMILGIRSSALNSLQKDNGLCIQLVREANTINYHKRPQKRFAGLFCSGEDPITGVFEDCGSLIGTDVELSKKDMIKIIGKTVDGYDFPDNEVDVIGQVLNKLLNDGYFD